MTKIVETLFLFVWISAFALPLFGVIMELFGRHPSRPKNQKDLHDEE